MIPAYVIPVIPTDPLAVLWSIAETPDVTREPARLDAIEAIAQLAPAADVARLRAVALAMMTDGPTSPGGRVRLAKVVLEFPEAGS